MTFKNWFLMLTVSCVAVSGTFADDKNCRPLPVGSITIDDSSTLLWAANPEDDCSVEYYIIQIHSGTTVDYIYRSDETSLDIDFLPVCESYSFIITAVSTEGISGIERVFFGKMPLPPDANLTVGLVMVSQHDDELYLRWVMDDAWEKCADRFRVIIFDEDDDTIKDEYTRDMSINITDLRPCTLYSFGVVALYNLILEGPVTVVERTIAEAVITPPRLQSINVQSRSADLTWGLEEFRKNRCAISSLEISTSSFNISQPIVDQPARLPVDVHLTNLIPGNMYVLNVTIINVAGYSTPIVLAFQTPES